jgi:predicted nucleic acid-binding protein
VIAYVDSSALLRHVLSEPGALSELRTAERLVSCDLLVVECLRTIDRLRLQGAMSAHEAGTRRRAAEEWMEAIDLVRLHAHVLSRASDPLPVPLGTLDALHLATALVWREQTGQALTMATHDAALALAARSYGIEVVG